MRHLRLFALLACGALPVVAPAANKEHEAIQRDISMLGEEMRRLQASLTNEFTAMKTMVQQSINASDKAQNSVLVLETRAKVHALKGLKLHAKMIVADEKRAVVGSINLAPGSFDARRELAIETDSHHVTKRLVETAERDWEHSKPIDLTDEGLLADLEKRNTSRAGAQMLVLKEHHRKKDKD